MSRYHAFLSHNSADKAAVEELARQLQQEGIEPWLDKWNLIPGNPWQEAIEQALDECTVCCVFIGPGGIGPWQNAEMRAAIDRRVSEGKLRVIPVLLPGAERGERSKLPTFLIQTTWVEFRRCLDEADAFHRLKCGIRNIPPGPDEGAATLAGQCPYRGLEVFDVIHQSFFFGREALTEWLLDEIRPRYDRTQNLFLAIIGPSGSGKSSLARAGLVAALKHGALPGSSDWLIYIFKPGDDPLASLALKLASSQTEVGTLTAKLAEQPQQLHLSTRFLLRERPETQRVVVLVDQFEEIFTLCRDRQRRQAFIDNLLHATSEPLGQTIVLLTIRADFYGKCAEYSTLAAALSDHQLLVGPMNDEELRNAIVKPAQLSGCEFESGLVERLSDDVRGHAGSLPLLQYALTEVWRQRQGRRLTHAAYEEIGCLEGALEKRANTIYRAFNDDQKAICRQIFLRLTAPGEGTEDTRRRVLLH